MNPLPPPCRAAGESWSHPQSGLVLRVRSIGASAADVAVCRKSNTRGVENLASCRAGLDGDCNGLVGLKDPQCIRLLAKAASRSSPQPRQQHRRTPRKAPDCFPS